jgi:hypothetical protein
VNIPEFRVILVKINTPALYPMERADGLSVKLTLSKVRICTLARLPDKVKAEDMVAFKGRNNVAPESTVIDDQVVVIRGRDVKAQSSGREGRVEYPALVVPALNTPEDLTPSTFVISPPIKLSLAQP